MKKKSLLILFIILGSIFFAQLDYFLMHAMRSNFRLYNPTRLVDGIDWLTKATSMFLVIYLSIHFARRFGDRFLGTTVILAGYFPVLFTTVVHVAFFSHSGNFFKNIAQMTQKVTMTGSAMVGHFITGAIVAITCLVFCRYFYKDESTKEIAPNLEE